MRIHGDCPEGVLEMGLAAFAGGARGLEGERGREGNNSNAE